MNQESTLGSVAQPKPSELERLSLVVAHTHELIAQLEQRLDPVVEAIPSDASKAVESRFHISTYIDDLVGANSRLDSLLHRIVL